MPSTCAIAKYLLAIIVCMCIPQSALSDEIVVNTEAHWLPLAQDGLHDPAVSKLGLLHNPSQVLSKLPHDVDGDQVNWVKALEKGYIKPSANMRSDTQMKVLDLDVLRRNTADMDMVLFPHKQHTEWLDCSNCHEALFKSKAGATKFGMFDILNGDYCGRCHGAVAFPLTECKRCHSVPRAPIPVQDRVH
jgi:c(7)-type cytochrome triheme protein